MATAGIEVKCPAGWLSRLSWFNLTQFARIGQYVFFVIHVFFSSGIA
jgi:hypothetical protein